MTKTLANKIYDILVTIGAKESERESFLYYQTESEYQYNEWRFQGKLAYGGKFYNDTNTIDCYTEDLTPERERIINEINIKLKQLMKIEVNDKITCNNSNPLDGNDIAPPLSDGTEYTLLGIHTCKCGKEHYNVGLAMEVNYVRCYDCKEELPITTHWCHPSRFTK